MCASVQARQSSSQALRYATLRISSTYVHAMQNTAAQRSAGQARSSRLPPRAVVPSSLVRKKI
eukprot:6186638-Pleurochrysis_carterae.AAC.2